LAVLFVCVVVFLFITWFVQIGQVTTATVVFSFVFLALAGGCWWFPVWARRFEERQLELCRAGINREEPTALVFSWIFGVAFGGFGLLFVFSDEPQPCFIVWPMCMVGVGALIKALIETFRRIKFGRSTLVRTSFSVPGKLVGVIHMRCKIPPVDGFRMSLKCIAWDGDMETSSDRVIWENQVSGVQGVFDRDTFRMAIPVDFCIPEVRVMREYAQFRSAWRLEVSAKVPGLKYRAAFQYNLVPFDLF